MPDETTQTDGGTNSKYTGNPSGKRFTKIQNAEYDRVNDFLKARTTFTAREWAIARACQDFRTPTGVPMQTVGENLPELIPFVTEEYSGQSISSAKSRFDEKVQKAANTTLYGSLSGFYTADELDEILYEAVETAKFLIEVEGGTIDAETEQRVERQLLEYMHEVRATTRRVAAEVADERENEDEGDGGSGNEDETQDEGENGEEEENGDD